MLILVLNCGSSSVKYRLFDMADESVLVSGLLERVGSAEAAHQQAVGEKKSRQTCSITDHKSGIHLILDSLTGSGAISSLEQIEAVGHRVVHGGEAFSESVRIDETVIETIRRYSALAPLHNPPNLMGIEAALSELPGAVHAAVFDTAFYTTLPEQAWRYAVPRNWYEQYGIRRYGFHGTSHSYVMGRTAELMGLGSEETHLITAHLGNGCSISAIRAARCVDHSLGFTPLEGLIMGTRSGDIDPAIIFHLVERENMPLEQVQHALQKESGLLGISGLSNDIRDLWSASEKGDAKADLAISMFAYRVRKYIGAYLAVLGEARAIVFTGGIGENDFGVRELALSGMENFGILLDCEANDKTFRVESKKISRPDSAVAVWVVATNEELLIARETGKISQNDAST